MCAREQQQGTTRTSWCSFQKRKGVWREGNKKRACVFATGMGAARRRLHCSRRTRRTTQRRRIILSAAHALLWQLQQIQCRAVTGVSYGRPRSTPGKDRSKTGQKLTAPGSGSRVMLACDVEGCAFTAEKKKYLIVHKRGHAGARTYACVEEDCAALFLTSRALATHAFKHTGDRPFACSTCAYTTTSKAYLLEHTRRHAGDMRHKCQVPACAFMHPLRAGLVRHSRAAHNCMPPTMSVQWLQRSRLYIGDRE